MIKYYSRDFTSTGFNPSDTQKKNIAITDLNDYLESMKCNMC